MSKSKIRINAVASLEAEIASKEEVMFRERVVFCSGVMFTAKMIIVEVQRWCTTIVIIIRGKKLFSKSSIFFFFLRIFITHARSPFKAKVCISRRRCCSKYR